MKDLAGVFLPALEDDALVVDVTGRSVCLQGALVVKTLVVIFEVVDVVVLDVADVDIFGELPKHPSTKLDACPLQRG